MSEYVGINPDLYIRHQNSIFNDDYVYYDVDIPHCYVDLLRFPNLPEHKHLIEDIKSVKNMQIGNEFEFIVNDNNIKCLIVDYNEFERPVCFVDDVLQIMKNDKFNDNVYWCLILIEIYLHFCADVLNELCSYKTVYEKFKTYKYNMISDLLKSYEYNLMFLKQNLRSFADVIYVIGINNKHRLVPETIESKANNKYPLKVVPGFECPIGYIENRLIKKEEYKRMLKNKFYFREI